MSNTIRIHLEGDGCWPDLATRQHDIIHIGDGAVIELAALENGMTSGRASVAFRIDLPDGRPIVAELSWRSLATAVQAIAARHGWPE